MAEAERTESAVLWLRAGGVPTAPAVAVRRVYSSALEHAGLPFVAEIRPPAGVGPVAGALLRIAGSNLEWPVRWATGVPAPGNFRAPETGAWRGYLDAIAGIRRVDVELLYGAERARAEVLFTDAWCWAWQQETFTALTTLVHPHDGVVRAIVNSARRAHAASTLSLPQAVFDCLRDEFEVAFQPPFAEIVPGNPPLQHVRPPHRLIFDLLRNRGEGNCIDLALLFAGCLEGLGEAPILILVHDDNGGPKHAIIAWWRDRARRYRPVLGAADLSKRWSNGEIAGVEVTRVCRNHATSFAAAQDEALGVLRASPSATGIDILATRPPTGDILPLTAAYDSHVAAAIATAERAAQDAGSTVVETLHLLFGMLTARGAIAVQLCAATHTDVAVLLEACSAEIANRARTDRAGRTRGFDRCLDDAAQNAKNQGSTVVRESDLWWALLANPSTSLHGTLPLPQRQTLMEALSHLAPSSRPRSTMA